MAVVIIALTVLNGFETVVKEKITSFNSHIYITGFGGRNLPDSENIVNRISDNLAENLLSISPFIQKYAVIKSKYLSEGVEVIGLDTETDNSRIDNFIVEGSYSFEPENSFPGVIVGKKLADRLFIKLDDKITLFGLRKDRPPSIDNPPLIEQFVVSGIYESGMSRYDDIKIYIDKARAKELFEIGENVSGYNIRLKSIAEVDSLSENLADLLGYPYHVRSIFRVHRSIFTWIELQKEPIPIVLGLIIIVAVFNIIGTLLMIVLERTGTIGVLKSLGANRKQVINIFLLQGVYLAGIGIFFGNLLALVLSLIQLEFNLITLPSDVYFISTVPIIIQWQNYALVSAITFILCILAAIIPSTIASKLNPITALRFD
jgi:lipoprotein-releasing system permease protein